MSSQYKQEEANLKKIISDYITPTDADDRIQLNIFYKNKKLRNLFIKNNPHNNLNNNDVMEKSRAVYMYECDKQECQPCTSYIGYTECTLKDRIRNHAQNGAIRSHNLEKHKLKITTNEIAQCTKVLRQLNTKEELTIAEAIYIKFHNPILNGQREGEVRVLPVF